MPDGLSRLERTPGRNLDATSLTAVTIPIDVPGFLQPIKGLVDKGISALSNEVIGLLNKALEKVPIPVFTADNIYEILNVDATLVFTEVGVQGTDLVAALTPRRAAFVATGIRRGPGSSRVAAGYEPACRNARIALLLAAPHGRSPGSRATPVARRPRPHRRSAW